MRIDGPGEATMPAAGGDRRQGTGDRGQESVAKGQAPQQKMHIVWQERLVFDGLTARFVGEVQTRTATQVALAPLLEATLSQRVDFQALGGPTGSPSSAETRVD